jgi:hypothetical protein
VWWVGFGYLLVAVLGWINYLLSGGGWRLIVALTWSVLGVGWAYVAETAMRRTRSAGS